MIFQAVYENYVSSVRYCIVRPVDNSAELFHVDIARLNQCRRRDFASPSAPAVDQNEPILVRQFGRCTVGNLISGNENCIRNVSFGKFFCCSGINDDGIGFSIHEFFRVFRRRSCSAAG